MVNNCNTNSGTLNKTTEIHLKYYIFLFMKNDFFFNSMHDKTLFFHLNSLHNKCFAYGLWLFNLTN